MKENSNTDKNKVNHTPNHIPPGARIMNIISSSILLIYGAFGVIIDDFYMPAKRGMGTHFHGEPLWIMYGAFLCAAASMLSVVVDHYDTRNNETNYKLFSMVTQIAGLTLFAFALILEFVTTDLQ